MEKGAIYVAVTKRRSKLWKHFKCDQLAKTLINHFHKHYNCNINNVYTNCDNVVRLPMN